MKQKVTISVDAELLSAAKESARTRGVSLSSYIERSLKEVVAVESPSFTSRWRGQFQPTERSNPRYDALSKKYLE